MADLNLEVRAYADRVALAAAADMLRDTDRRAPVRTGQLRGTGDIVRKGSGRVEIRYPAEYASFTDTGTRPHTIRPRNRKVLRFRVGSTLVYTRRVDHPGTRGTRWYSDVVNLSGWQAALRRAAGRVR